MNVNRSLALAARPVFAFLLPVAVSALSLCANAAPPPIVLSRSVVGSGGGFASGPGRTMTSTAGQPAVGLSSGPSNRIYHGFWGSGGYLVLAVEPPAGAALPKTLSLGRVYPNPSQGAVNLELALPRAGDVRLAVYDVAGRRAYEFRMGTVGAGLQRVTWQPPQGMAGVYFAKLYVDRQLVGERRVVLTH